MIDSDRTILEKYQKQYPAVMRKLPPMKWIREKVIQSDNPAVQALEITQEITWMDNPRPTIDIIFLYVMRALELKGRATD